jgi:two-component system response regulator YesN
VIHYEDLKRVDEDISSVFSQDHRNGNRRAVEALDAAAVQDDIQIIYEQLSARSDYSPLKLFCLIETFAQIIRETWEENAVEEQIISEFTYTVEELMDRSTTEARLIQRFQDAVEYYFRKVLEQRRQNGSASIREAKQYLAEHYRENPSLEEVADRVGMSPTYLSAMFKKEVGIGFSDYLIQLRCEEAKRLIRTTQEPLAAVAEAVGYQDPKYFSRIFRKTVGIKPSEYRKLYQ